MEETNTNYQDFTTTNDKNSSNWISSLDGDMSSNSLVKNTLEYTYQFQRDKNPRNSDIVASSIRKDRPSYTNGLQQNFITDFEDNGLKENFPSYSKIAISKQITPTNALIIASKQLTPKNDNQKNPLEFSVSTDQQVEDFIKKITEEATNLKCEEHGQNLLNICTDSSCPKKFWCGICCVKFKKDFSSFIESMMTIEDFIVENTNKLKNHKVYSHTDKQSIINIIDANEDDKNEKYNLTIEKIDSDINTFKDMVINMIEKGRKEIKQLYLDSQSKGSEFYQELRGKITNLDLIDPNKKILEMRDDFCNNNKSTQDLIMWLEETADVNLPDWEKRNKDFEDIKSFTAILLDNEDNWQKKIVANYQPFSHWKEDSSRKIEKNFLPLLKMSFKSQEKDLRSFFNYYNSLPTDGDKLKKCKDHILHAVSSDQNIKVENNTKEVKSCRNMHLTPKASVIVNHEFSDELYGGQNKSRPSSGHVGQMSKYMKRPETDSNMESMFYSRHNLDYEIHDIEQINKSNIAPQEIDSSYNNYEFKPEAPTKSPADNKQNPNQKSIYYTNILEKKFNLNQPGENQGVQYPKIETLTLNKPLEISPEKKETIENIEKKYANITLTRPDYGDNWMEDNKKYVPTQIASNNEVKLDYMKLSGNLVKESVAIEASIAESINISKFEKNNQQSNLLHNSLKTDKMLSLNSGNVIPQNLATSYEFNISCSFVPKLDLKKSQNIKDNFQPEQDPESNRFNIEEENDDMFKTHTQPNKKNADFNVYKRITERDSEFDNKSISDIKYTPKNKVSNRVFSIHDDKMNITPETMNNVVANQDFSNMDNNQRNQYDGIKEPEIYESPENKIIKKYTLNLEGIHNRNKVSEQNFKKNAEITSQSNVTGNFNMGSSDYRKSIDPGSFGGNFQEEKRRSIDLQSKIDKMSPVQTNNFISGSYSELDKHNFTSDINHQTNSDLTNYNTVPFNMINYYSGDTQLSQQTKVNIKNNSIMNDGCIIISYAINDVTPVILLIKNKYILTSFCKQGQNKDYYFGFNVMKIERSAQDQYTPYLYSSDKDIIMNARIDNIIFTHRDSDATDLVIVATHDGSIFQFKVEENSFDFFNIKLSKKIRPISKGLYFTWISNYKSSDLLLCCSYNGKVYMFDSAEGLQINSENIFDGCISSTAFVSGYNMIAFGSGSSNQKHENSITVFELEMNPEIYNTKFSNNKKSGMLSFSQKIKLKNCHGEKFGVFSLSSTNIRDNYMLFSGGCDDDSRIKVWNLLKDPCLLYEIKTDESIVNFMANIICFGVQQLDETQLKNKDNSTNKYGSTNSYLRSVESVATKAHKSHQLNERRDELKRIKEQLGSNEVPIQYQGFDNTGPSMMSSGKVRSPGIGEQSSLMINQSQFDKYASNTLSQDVDKNGNIENHVLLIYTKNFIRVINFQMERQPAPTRQENLRLMEEDSIEIYMNAAQEFRITHSEHRIPFNTKSAIYSRVLQTRKVSDKQFNIMAASSNKQISCYNLFI